MYCKSNKNILPSVSVHDPLYFLAVDQVLPLLHFNPFLVYLDHRVDLLALPLVVAVSVYFVLQGRYLALLSLPVFYFLF